MLLFFFLTVTIDANEWSYTDPNDWGGTCSTGKEQSPINIDTATTEHITLPPLEFNDYNVRGSISDLNNGHTEMVQGFTSWTKQPSISGGGLLSRFILNQFHFHWDTRSNSGSEHRINGQATPLELHLVHTREDLNESTAGSVPGGMAVVTVLFVEHFNGHPLFELGAVLAGNKYYNNSEVNSWYSPRSLLPRDTSSYYRYTGSLTTPPCTEGVIWTILEEPNYITPHQLDTMRQYFSNDEHLIIENHRPIQPLNGRKLYHVQSQRNLLNRGMLDFLDKIRQVFSF